MGPERLVGVVMGIDRRWEECLLDMGVGRVSLAGIKHWWSGRVR